jgi:hypothetical protein
MADKNKTGALGKIARGVRARIEGQKPEDRELIRKWNKAADVPNSYQRRPHISDEEFERMQRGEVLYPLVAYHGTPHKFDEFARGDVGFHMGTKEQALKRLKDLGYGSGSTIEPLVMPLRVNVRSPLRVDRDPGDWRTKDAIATVAYSPDLKINSSKIEYELDNLLRNSPFGGLTYNSPEQRKLRSILQRSGYDSILYPNAVENRYGRHAGESPRFDNLMSDIQRRRANAAQSPDYKRQDLLDKKLERAEDLYRAGIGKNDNRSWIVFDPRDIRHQNAQFSIDDMKSANIYKADGGMVDDNDAERLAAMHAALDREAALRNASRYEEGGSVEAPEQEGIPVPPDLVPMIHEQLGLRFADGGVVDWSRYGEVPQTAAPAAPAPTPVPVPAPPPAADPIESAMSRFQPPPQDAPGSPPEGPGAGGSTSPSSRSIGTGYDRPGTIGSTLGGLIGSGLMGGVAGNLIGAQMANKDLEALGASRVSPGTAAVAGAIPFGGYFGMPTPQNQFNDIVRQSFMPDEYTSAIGRLTDAQSIPGVNVNVEPGMGPPGSPGSDETGQSFADAVAAAVESGQIS